jgi:hypothetical protein
MRRIVGGVLALVLMSSSLMANQRLNDRYKQQCQYRVYGTGEFDSLIAAEMIGVVNGIVFMIKPSDRSDYAKAPFGTIIDKACQNALNNMSNLGFENDYKLAVLILLNKNFLNINK